MSHPATEDTLAAHETRGGGEAAAQVSQRQPDSPWHGHAVVHGKAQGMGSKRIGRIAGRPVILDNKDAPLRTFQESLSCEMLRTRPDEPLNGAVSVAIRIFVARPAGHYGAKGLKPSAPVYPASGAFHDADKVCRSVLDCGSTIWFRDDKRVTDLTVSRRYADDGPERVEVEAWGLAGLAPEAAPKGRP